LDSITSKDCHDFREEEKTEGCYGSGEEGGKSKNVASLLSWTDLTMDFCRKRERGAQCVDLMCYAYAIIKKICSFAVK
jgi:hypothetical protein